VAEADLRIAVDNGYRLLLDGRELGIGSDWRSVTEYNITLLLEPGWHVLAVEAFNDNREAGMLFGLKIELTDGRKIVIPSDHDWRIVPANERGWQRRHTAPAHWGRALVVSAFLPRTGGWFAREPTMIVKVPVLRPVELEFWRRGWFQAVLAGVVVVAVLVCLRLMARLAVHSKAQAMLQRERARIARDIHDELGARLTELALEGEVAQTELPAGSAARSRFEALSERARALSGAMDEVVWMVNSRRDTLRDFATYACKHAQRFLASTPICCRLDVDPELPEVVFDLPVRRNLLLAVKEALNNAVKYSGATELFLRIHRHGQTVLVVVEDNGAGFDPETVDPARNGLTNMAERMREVDGWCRIVSSEGAGCRVEFQVPLPKSPTRPAAGGRQTDLPLARFQRVPPAPPTPATRKSKEPAT
jgi:signal transduction histidine kinase